MARLDALLDEIRPQRQNLVAHPVYEAVASAEALRVFTEHHVYAVWDFMTLLKALQRTLTCVELPWRPVGDRQTRRLINEIVLAEESDDAGTEGAASHFELYLEAMKQLGADTQPVDRFLGRIESGDGVIAALADPSIPEPSRRFVTTTWRIVESGSIPAIAAAFTLGREEIIPDLFRGLVRSLHDQEPARFGKFLAYLDRHVHLDEDEHGPMALRMLTTVCGDDPLRWEEAASAARAALEARLGLWDGVVAVLSKPAMSA
jgi:hypothetical protein